MVSSSYLLEVNNTKFSYAIILTILAGLYSYNIPYLISRKKDTFLMLVSLGVIVGNILGDILLIPKFGIFGAIYASIISIALGFITALIENIKFIYFSKSG